MAKNDKKTPDWREHEKAAKLLNKMKRKAQGKPEPGKWVPYKRRKVVLFNRHGEPEDMTPFPLGKSNK